VSSIVQHLAKMILLDEDPSSVFRPRELNRICCFDSNSAFGSRVAEAQINTRVLARMINILFGAQNGKNIESI